MARDLIIIGAGGFGREVYDVVEAINGAGAERVWNFLGFIDDGQPDVHLLPQGLTSLLGGMDVIEDFSTCLFVIAIGAANTRRQLDAQARARRLAPATLVHPTATFGRDVTLGDGTIVCSHVSITTHVRIGRHVHLNLNSTVGHDATLGDFVTVYPGVTVSGNVRLADDVTMGTNSTVIQGLSVGTGTVVGAGAAVVRDLPAGVTAVGVPARPITHS